MNVSTESTSAVAGRRAGVRRRVGRRVVNGAAVFALLYLFAPIAVIVVFSFNRPAGKFNLVWQHFTFRNWMHPFDRKELTQAMVLSLRIAVLAALIATALGTLVALALTRYRFRGSAAVNLLLVLPFLLLCLNNNVSSRERSTDDELSRVTNTHHASTGLRLLHVVDVTAQRDALPLQHV